MSIKSKRGPGRPKLPPADKAAMSAVSLTPDLAAFARELGDGSLSRGVQKALIGARERRRRRKSA